MGAAPVSTCFHWTRGVSGRRLLGFSCGAGSSRSWDWASRALALSLSCPCGMNTRSVGLELCQQEWPELVRTARASHKLKRGLCCRVCWQTPAWLEQMIAHTTWRDLFYKLAEAHPDCLMLNFTVKVGGVLESEDRSVYEQGWWGLGWLVFFFS